MSRPNSHSPELVFCHHCENEWSKDEFGLQCPSCRSDFTEIIGPDFSSAEARVNRHPLHSHSPWQDAPDPDEDDIDQLRWTQHGPNSFSFSGGFYGNSRTSPPSDQPLLPFPPSFHQILQTLIQLHPTTNPQSGYQAQFQRQPRAGGQFHSSEFRTSSMPGVEIRTSPGASFTYSSYPAMGGRMEGQPGIESPVNEFHEYGSLSSNMSITSPTNRNARVLSTLFGAGQSAMGGGQAPFADLIHRVLHRNGDAVYSQEALDRVISQLMEQNTSGNAPGPASNDAIAALPRKKITADMLDECGSGECSICMENVQLGDEVTVLPCSHWFHSACIEAWLREHDTCPHCRAGITPKDGSRDSVRTPSEPPLNNQDPFELARRQSGAREHPYVVAESPSRARRHPSRGRQIPSASEGHHTGRRRGQEQADNSGGNGGGGLTGSIRNWFGGGSNAGNAGGGNGSGGDGA